MNAPKITESISRILGSSPIFQDIKLDIKSSEIQNLMFLTKLEKDQFLFHQGTPVDFIGFVISGAVLIVTETSNGQRTIITQIKKGQHFAESISFLKLSESPVAVVAAEETTILKINLDKLLNTINTSDSITVMRNLLRLASEKNLLLQNRINILTQPNIENKVLCLLNQLRGDSPYITTDFNRQEMAQYLCVERTALSHQLSVMKRKGLIDYHKNSFKLL